MEKPTKPAAVADPGPAEDPCEPIVRSQGFFVCPPNHSSSRANSPVASLATNTAPASFNREATVASTLMIRLLKGAAPQVVGYPFTAHRSFAPQGIPCRGPRYRPAAISLSALLAWRFARSSVIVTAHVSFGLYLLRRSRYISVSSMDFTCLVRTISASCVTGQKAKSSRFLGRLTRGGMLLRKGFFERSIFMPGTTGLK